MTTSSIDFIAIFKKSYIIAKPFFTKDKKLFAWCGLALLILLILFGIFINVQLVNWSKRFFDALQNIDKKSFFKELYFFALIASLYISSAVIRIFIELTYALYWRKWMTHNFINKWLSSYSFYGMKLLKTEVDNPDQRISQDINEFTIITIDLFLGFTNSIVTLVTFIVILWKLSYVFSIKVLGFDIKIYGSFVWVALIYSIVGTYLTKYIGGTLASLLFIREKREARFRFSLIRVIENAEPISFYKATNFEQQSLLNNFLEIVRNTKLVISKEVQVMSVKAFYKQISIILPYLLTFSLFFAKKITLGGVMRIQNVFLEVHEGFSWIVLSYKNIALLNAVTERLEQFIKNIDLWQEHYDKKKIKIIHKGNNIKIENLTLNLPNGDTLLRADKINITGKSYLIEGRSGIGKTTLFKALSGIWISGEGKITMPHYKKILFISQKNYMPIGKLRYCFVYPLIEFKEDKKLKDLMKIVNLEYLIDKLDKEEEWGHILSIGEQQKIAILRAIILKPSMIFLDEATSAMDSKSKELVYELLKTKLKKTKIISIGHEKYLRKFHKEIISIKNKTIEIKNIKKPLTKY